MEGTEDIRAGRMLGMTANLCGQVAQEVLAKHPLPISKEATNTAKELLYLLERDLRPSMTLTGRMEYLVTRSEEQLAESAPEAES